MSPNILIFSSRLLPASETFIKSQSERLVNFNSYYLGARRVNGIPLDADRTLVINDGGLVGLAKEWSFKKLGISPQIYSAIRTINPVLMHAHFGVCGALALPIAQTLRLPLVVTYHGFDACMTDDYARCDSLSTRVYLRRRDALKQKVQQFIAVSQFIKDRLVQQGFPESKILVHYIGVDVDQFQPDLSLPRRPVVLFVGRLTEKKGCEYLIRAMAQVQTNYPDAKLVVIGDGTLRRDLEAQAQASLKSYKFLGMQPPEIVREWMNKSLVLAAPSVTTTTGDSEGLPMVIIEAQAMGLPVVGSVHAGIPEAIAHGKTGFLAPERDWQALAGQIQNLLQDSDLWQQFSHTGQQRVQTDFNLHRQGQALEAIYKAVIDRASHIPSSSVSCVS